MDKPQLALNLLRDDFFMGEINALREGCLKQFENSRADDYEVRENSYLRLKAINEIVSHFESIAAAKQMEQKRWKIL